MPRTRSLAWAELKIGILGMLAMVLASVLIFAVGGQGGFPWQRYELITKFADVRGLKAGAVVRVAGVEMGKVTDVRFSGAGVEIVMELSKEMKPIITTESRASIGSLSLLGEPVIDIIASQRGTSIPEGGFVQPGRAEGQIADVAEGASRSLEQATALLQDIRAGKGSVGKLFTDDQLYREISEFVSSAASVATQISRGRGTLGRLTTDPTAYNQLNRSLANLEAITRRINSGEGALGRLLRDEQMAKSMNSISGNVDAVTGRLNRGEGTAGKLLTDAELYNRFNRVAGSLDQLSARLNEGQGTAGQLLHDKQLYDNMNSAASELRGLIAEIRKDPKRYLNVKVSIF
ncbi:MAG TPA: MlaD family protein [Vicinamibacterales bacterium]|nr:MlaD family protein [Vicinamibacterales bacterium]